MYSLVMILILIVCVLLVLTVLVQNSKGGGLASSFSSSNQIMGVRKTTNFLEKATWFLAGSLLVLCFLAAGTIDRVDVEGQKSSIEEQINNEVVGGQEQEQGFGTEAPVEAPKKEETKTEKK